MSYHNQAVFTQAMSDAYYYDASTSGINPVVVKPGNCWGIADTTELLAAVGQLRSHVLLIQQQKGPGEAVNDPRFEASGVATPNRMEILVASAPITFKTQQFKGAVYLRGDDAACRPILQTCFSYGLDFHMQPGPTWNQYTNCLPVAPNLQAIPVPKERAFVVKMDDVLAFIEDSTVTIPEKIVSGYLLAFPQTARWILQECDVFPYSAPGPALSTASAPTPVQQMCVTGILVLTPAYSRDERLAQQLFRRINAAAVAGGFPAVSQTDVQSIVDGASWVASSPSRLGPELAGRACALTKTFTYDPDVFIEDLAGISEVASHFELDKWTTQLLVQARLVFHNFQAVSLHFGYNVAEIGREMLVSLGGSWTAELDLMDGLTDKMIKSAYIGCRTQVPEGHQVKTMPRIIYIGAYYYKINLTSEEEKAEFTFFNIEGIAKHISPTRDVVMCQTIAQTLPAGPVISLGTLLASCSISTAESVINKHSEEIKKAVYFYLRDRHPTSPWYQDQRGREEATLRIKIRKNLADEIDKIQKSTAERLSNLAARERDDKKRASLLSELDDYQAQYNRMVAQRVSIADITPAAPRADLDDIRQQLMEDYTPLYYLAMRMTPPTPTQPTSGNPPTAAPQPQPTTSQGQQPSSQG